MKNQLPMMPFFMVKQTGKFFPTLQEAALSIGTVTVNKNYSLFFRKVPISVKKTYGVMASNFCSNFTIKRNSLFKEIEVISLSIPEFMRSLFKKRVRVKTIKPEVLASTLVDRITSFMENNWNTSKAHIMPHSSGYDSRLISVILKKLTDKNGVDWLGDLYFISWDPEVKGFKDIMAHEQWPEKHQIIITGKGLDFYKDAVKFDNVGRYCSDVNRFICYCFDYIIYKAIEGLGVNDVQIISGLFSDEILRKEVSKARKDTIWNNLSHFMVHFLHDIHFEWSMYDTLLPFMSFDVIDTILDYDLPKADDLKLMMIRSLDSALADLPNYRFEYFDIIRKEGIHPFYRLSKPVVKEMEASFKNSWYFKNVKNVVFPELVNGLVNDGIWLKEYTKAAICEYILNRGCMINV